MSYSATRTAAFSDPTHLFRRAINVMMNFGQDLLGRIQGATKQDNFDHLPRRWRDKQRAEHRLMRTLDWVLALARILSGDSLYLLPAPRPAAANPRPARARPATPATPIAEEELEDRRGFARLRYMRKIFATQPTSRIAKRLARRLGAKEGTDWWPDELLTMSETPAAWAARNRRPDPEQPANQPPESEPDSPSQANPAPVAFHRRE